MRSVSFLLCACSVLVGCTADIDQLLGPKSSDGQNVDGQRPGGDNGGDSAGGSNGSNDAPVDPGHAALRRLNRSEYNRTVRDLLGTNLTPADDFPADDVSFGFDTIGDVLSISPLHLELYDAAADKLTAELFARAADDALRTQILGCASSDAETCAEEVIARFAKRAFRRPPSADELNRINDIVTAARSAGAGADEALALGLRAILISPHFLFRVETDEDPTSTKPHPLSPYEVATRLSYFLWGTMPDDELLARAEDGTLATREGVRTEAARMLDDERAKALTTDFAGQWLFIRAMESHEVDTEAFPTYDADLRAAMVEETQRFFGAFLTEDRPFTELLTADFTFVNAKLAEHYGLPAPASGFEKVSLTSTDRRGLLGQASLLTLTSVPTRTSPVKRGKWVLEQILCSALPPPPPDVVPLDESDTTGLPLRERLAEHRKNPACASCHNVMDPIGLGLESFDAIGRFRDKEGGIKVDSSGTLPDGRSFDGAPAMLELLSSDDRFSNCLTKQLLVFGIGRQIGKYDDSGFIKLILAGAEERGGSLRELILSIVESDLFRARRGLSTEGEAP